MALTSTDVIKVYRSSSSPYCFKETFGNRSNIADDDLLIVERGGNCYKCTYSDWNGGGGGGGGGGSGYSGSNLVTLNGGSNVSFNITTSSTATSSDSTAAYNTLAAGFDGSTTTGYLYIGLRLRGSTNYYHDFCLGGVQILNTTGTAFRTDSTYSNGYDWIFGGNGNSDGWGAWRRCSSSLSSQTYTADPSSLSYTTIGTASNGNWCSGSSTGSSNTGAADGIYGPSTYSGGGGSIIPNTGTIAQSSSTNFLFTETSGSGYTIGTTCLWLRSPQITVYDGDYLRLAYLAVGGNTSSNGLGAFSNDTLYFRFK